VSFDPEVQKLRQDTLLNSNGRGEGTNGRGGAKTVRESARGAVVFVSREDFDAVGYDERDEKELARRRQGKRGMEIGSLESDRTERPVRSLTTESLNAMMQEDSRTGRQRLA